MIDGGSGIKIRGGVKIRERKGGNFLNIAKKGKASGKKRSWKTCLTPDAKFQRGKEALLRKRI